MLLEIEYFFCSCFLKGQKIEKAELKRQIDYVEKNYNKEKDDFVEVMCEKFHWEVVATSETPSFRYDRDIEKLFEVIV